MSGAPENGRLARPVSILDLAPIRRGESVTESFASSVALARRAESLGYTRVWYAEHHNIASIASSATSVLIAHIAAMTERIRLGAGGVMLPNHAPLTIAEQFGTLESLHPGRIDLGLGRAPGTDPRTLQALRRDAHSADRFPDDVVELQGYLRGESVVPGVEAVPGKGTNVPLYILGSSLFGARLAAILGLPYAFASHFAPAALEVAVALYRKEFRPSTQLERPYVIAGVNVVVAEGSEEAAAEFERVRRNRVVSMLARGREVDEQEADLLVRSPAGQQVQQMLAYAAVGTPDQVRAYLDWFSEHAGCDEVMVVFQTSASPMRLRAAELTARAMGAP